MTESRSWHTLDQEERKLLGCEPTEDEEAIKPEPQDGRHHRHFPSWRQDPPEKERIGLALSGGGLRSATFNLGLLQKLDELKLLSAFDYLATVSGGGYIGGFWSAWRAREKEARSGRFPKKQRQDPEAPEIRHLREFGNFLKPRMSLLSAETGRILAGVVGAVVPSVTISLAFLLLALGMWLGAACVLLGEFPRFWLPALGFASLTLVAHVLFELGSKGRLEQEASLARFEYRWWVVGSVALAFTSWLVLWHVLPLPLEHLLQPVSWDDLTSDEVALALFPSIAWLVVAVLLIVPRTLSSQHYSKDSSTRAGKGALDRVLAQVLFAAGIWAAGGVAWLGGQVLAAGGLGGLFTAVAAGTAGGGGFAWARSLLSVQPNKPSGGSRLARLQPWLPRILAYLTLTAAATGVVSLMVLVHSRFGTSGLVILLGVGLFVILVAVRSYHPHENGFHAFYRARLSRAFLGASNPCTADHPHAALECEGDDLFINELPEDKPLHLICCAANDLAGDELTTLHRGADSAVLSRLGLQVGDRWEPWNGTTNREVPLLSSAITASGAAFNSHMGSISMRLGRITCFLFAALSLRLGLWLENPQARTKRFRDLQRHRPGLLFLRELLGLSRSDASWIYLSDGAHFENLAFYELIRRHCRFIVVSDCGADPDVAFDDFGNAVRRVREDFGVEVDIDLSPLQSKDSRQPMVAGDIRYSEKDIGWLFYIKPTLVGNEPPDIAQYARRNQDFPHETTLDQFYDEAQWEAYRRLGMHVAEKAFERLCKENQNPKDPPEDKKPAPIRTFLAARYEWRPIADEKSEELVKLEEQWGKLEGQLADSDAKRLCAQVLTPTVSHGKNRKKPPSDDDRVAALPFVREALRLMDAIYHQTDLNATPYSPSHPRHRGILNRFGRWASAPLFRSWWLWLAPLHSHSLIRFLVEVFELPNPLEWKKEEEPQEKSGTRIEELKEDSQGYALDRWEALKRDKNSKDEEDPTKTRYGCFVPMVDDGNQTLMAGLVLLKRNTQKKTAEWNTQDFFIPPGLWGIKVSDAFLESLVKHFTKDSEVHELIISIAEDSPNTATNALYTGAGFHREKRNLENRDLKNTDLEKGDFFVRDLTTPPARSPH